MEQYIIFGCVVFVIAMIVLAITLLKPGKEKNGKSKGKVRQETEKLLPQRYYDKVNRSYVLKDGKYMDIYQIQSKDLTTASDDEVEYDNLKFCKFYRLYENDIKIVVMNFPCNTKEQQEYLTRQMNRTTNVVFKEFLKRQIAELIWIEKKTTTREYYMMFFAKSLDELEDTRRTIKTTLHTGRDGMIMEIPDEKKHQILYRMTNKCSQVV